MVDLLGGLLTAVGGTDVAFKQEALRIREENRMRLLDKYAQAGEQRKWKREDVVTAGERKHQAGLLTEEREYKAKLPTEFEKKRDDLIKFGVDPEQATQLMIGTIRTAKETSMDRAAKYSKIYKNFLDARAQGLEPTEEAVKLAHQDTLDLINRFSTDVGKAEKAAAPPTILSGEKAKTEANRLFGLIKKGGMGQDQLLKKLLQSGQNEVGRHLVAALKKERASAELPKKTPAPAGPLPGEKEAAEAIEKVTAGTEKIKKGGYLQSPQSKEADAARERILKKEAPTPAEIDRQTEKIKAGTEKIKGAGQIPPMSKEADAAMKKLKAGLLVEKPEAKKPTETPKERPAPVPAGVEKRAAKISRDPTIWVSRVGGKLYVKKEGGAWVEFTTGDKSYDFYAKAYREKYVDPSFWNESEVNKRRSQAIKESGRTP